MLEFIAFLFGQLIKGYLHLRFLVFGKPETKGGKKLFRETLLTSVAFLALLYLIVELIKAFF